MFELHATLDADTIKIGDFKLSKLLMIKDQQYPWFLLVPKQNDLLDICDLSDDDQRQFWEESALLSKEIKRVFSPDKLNLGAIGNMVPQLHVHHIARFKDDVAWPAPVWGAKPLKAFDDEALTERMQSVKQFDFSSMEFTWEA